MQTFIENAEYLFPLNLPRNNGKDWTFTHFYPFTYFNLHPSFFSINRVSFLFYRNFLPPLFIIYFIQNANSIEVVQFFNILLFIKVLVYNIHRRYIKMLEIILLIHYYILKHTWMWIYMKTMCKVCNRSLYLECGIYLMKPRRFKKLGRVDSGTSKHH